MNSNEKGFTLIEMLVVLVIISVLIILIIPNLSGKTKEVHNKGCEALKSLVQAQADSYHLDNGTQVNSLNTLVAGNYIEESQKTCPNKKILTITAGKVSVQSPE